MKRAAFLLLVPFLAACALISPPAEDLAAVRAAAERLPVLADASERVYRETIDGLTAELRKRAKAEVAQATDYELLKASTARDPEGNPVPITPERVAQIMATKATLEERAEASIANVSGAAMNHTVHGDLRLVVDLLRDYLVARATDDERRAAVAQSAHDLVFKKKDVK